MDQVANRRSLIVLAYAVAAAVIAAPSCATERLAMADFAGAMPANGRNLNLDIDRNAKIARNPIQIGPEAQDFSYSAGGKRRSGKALRIDLFRLEVRRQSFPETPGNSATDLSAGVIYVSVKRGVGPDTKTIGVELPVVSHVVVESRFGSGGEGVATVRFRLRY